MQKLFCCIEQAEKQGEDRAHTISNTDRDIFIIADGAGGLAGGDMAADMFIELVSKFFTKNHLANHDSILWEKTLRDVDKAIMKNKEAGETAGIVLIKTNKEFFGVSVGDCQGWLFNNDFCYEFTTHQYRKPLLGSGNAIPVAFGPFPATGKILMGSDGLFDYTSNDKIKNTVTNLPTNQVCTSLVNSVRLPSGKLQDDIAIIFYSM